MTQTYTNVLPYLAFSKSFTYNNKIRPPIHQYNSMILPFFCWLTLGWSAVV